ncbi:MAG: hypothetical protein ABL891_18745 [Burkholderiales bacterium]
MHPFHVLLSVFALFALVAFAFMSRWERSKFVAKGKGHGWRRVRISTIPIAIFAAAIAVVPTQVVSGMESLALLYGLLFTVVPIFWFGAHWLVGKSASPPLSFGESAAIAGSPIVFGLAAAYTAHALQTPAWLFLKHLGLV